jgi:hypothetical protein
MMNLTVSCRQAFVDERRRGDPFFLLEPPAASSCASRWTSLLAQHSVQPANWQSPEQTSFTRRGLTIRITKLGHCRERNLRPPMAFID